MNRTRTDHVITIEDPIEFVHENKKCLINQRQVGEHTDSFKDALRAALREDPDIVLVGEMRDLETVAIAIETAETGHLVFGTLHTSSAPSTVDRIIDQFPADRQGQIRVMLAESLKGVISQILCKKIGGGRVPVLEVLIGIPSVANLIREAKIYQIPSIMQTGKKHGMVHHDRQLPGPGEAEGGRRRRRPGRKAIDKATLLASVQEEQHRHLVRTRGGGDERLSLATARPAAWTWTRPPAEALERAAAAAARAARLLIYPTETLYALGGRALDAGRRPIASAPAKGRGDDKPLPLIAADVAAGPRPVRRLAGGGGAPGGALLAGPAHPGAAGRRRRAARGHRGRRHGRRSACPARRWRARCARRRARWSPPRRTGRASRPPTRCAEALGRVGSAVALALDGGPWTARAFDHRGPEHRALPRMLREGAVARADVLAALG